jgi:hypothetical protein
MSQRFIVVRTTANKAHPAPAANRPNVNFSKHFPAAKCPHPDAIMLG